MIPSQVLQHEADLHQEALQLGGRQPDLLLLIKVCWSVVLMTVPEAALRRFQTVALTPALGVEAKLVAAAVVKVALSTNASSISSSTHSAVSLCPGVCSARVTIPTKPAKMNLISPALTSLTRASCLRTTSPSRPALPSPIKPMLRFTRSSL